MVVPVPIVLFVVLHTYVEKPCQPNDDIVIHTMCAELWDQLQQAQQMPEAVDVAQLLDKVEAAAAQLPETQRLQFAGDALLQIAELCAVRAEVLMI